MRKWRIPLHTVLLMLLPIVTQGQGVIHTNFAWKQVTPSGSTGVTGNILQPIPAATITVCSGTTVPSSGTICTGLATIYQNSTLTTGQANPFPADAGGNYSFYAAPGRYIVSVSSSGLTTYSYGWTAAIPTDANVALTGVVTLSNLNGDVYFDGTKYTTIQAAVNACANPGVKVVLPAGSYTLTTGLTSNCQNLEFRGASGTGDELSSGSISTDCPTTVVVPSGQVGFTFNPTGSVTNFRGPTIRDICFVGQSGALGGIRILRSNNFTIDHIGASYFSGSGAYGVFSDGTGNVNQYGVITNSTIVGNNIDVKSLLNSGLRILHNHLDNAANTGIPTAGTKGVYINCPAASQNTTHIIANNIISGSDVLVDSECGQNDTIRDNRFEGFTTAAIRLQQLNSLTATGVKISGGSINNFINGSVGTGVLVGSGVSSVQIDIPSIAAVATIVSPQTDTQYNVGNILELPQAGQIQFGNGGDNLIQRIANGRLKITNNLELNGALIVDGGTVGPSVAQQHTLPAVASDTFALLAASQTITNKSTSAGPVTGTVASGTASMTTAAITAGACGTTVTVTASGVLTTDRITANPNAAQGAPNGLLTLNAWPTSGNVNFAYCNPTASSQTPTANTVNWEVTR